MRYAFNAVFLAIVLLIPNLAASQEILNVHGAGANTCVKFLDNQKNSLNMPYVHWLQGFLSGMNYAEEGAGQKRMGLPDWETGLLYVAEFCRQHPLERVADGAVALYRELRAREQLTPNEL